MTNQDEKKVALEEDQGRLYWLFHNLSGVVGSFFRRHWFIATVLLIAVAFLLMYNRSYFHSFVLGMRIYSAEIVVLLVLGGFTWYAIKREWWRTLVAVDGTIVVFVLVTVIFGFSPHSYVTHYLYYSEMDPEDLSNLPETRYDMVQPLNAIHTLSRDYLVDVERSAIPDRMMIDGLPRFVQAIEPKTVGRQLMENILSLFSVSATAATPSFGGENRIPVNFCTGENLYLGKNAATVAIRSFGFHGALDFLRYFSYEPVDVKFAKDARGEWIQIISMIRWKGIFFPRPVFGGVQIIRQENCQGKLSSFKRLTIGLGEWIPKSEIDNHSFLVGQNLVPYKVVRFAAESLRFQSGFFAPMPGYHINDLRLPDLPGDENELPFGIYFHFGDKMKERNKLYLYSSLVPWDETKRGLNTSLLYPADGIGPLFRVRHQDLGHGYIGPNAIPQKIRGSLTDYYWKTARTVEPKPYVRDIDGVRRVFYLTTIVHIHWDPSDKGSEVAVDSKNKQQFETSAVPKVALVDAVQGVPVWITANEPNLWPSEVQNKLKEIWADR